MTTLSEATPISTPGYVDHGVSKLHDLCTATAFPKPEAALAVFRTLAESWGDRGPTPAGVTQPYAGTPWRSDVSDDQSPFEVSAVYGGSKMELRVLVEALGESATLQSNWDAGVALSERLARDYGADLERESKVRELFRPRVECSLAMWHAASFVAGQPPVFKIYFDAHARGAKQAPALIAEALARLGFEHGWAATKQRSTGGAEPDDLKYLSLDLEAGAARVKVYARHRAANVSDVVRIAADFGLTPEDVRALCTELTGTDGPYLARPLFTCSALVDPRSSAPASRTLYIPVSAYSESDAVAVERVRRVLERHEIDPAHYLATVHALGKRRLEESSGLQSYVSVQQRRGRTQVTVYFNSEVHQVAPPRTISKRVQMSLPLPATEIVRRYEHDVVLENHPFMEMLRRNPVDLASLWLVLANFWEGIVHDFPARVAHVVAKLDDDKIRCLFAKQLNDELGDGDYSRAHKPMYQRLVDAVAAHRVPGDLAPLLEPGRQLGKDFGVQIFDPDPYVAIGAMLIIEVWGKQTDLQLGAQFRRQDVISHDALHWLHLHEELEVDHAEESMTVATLLPSPDAGPEAQKQLEAVWRGARGIADAAWLFFDRLHAIRFQ